MCGILWNAPLFFQKIRAEANAPARIYTRPINLYYYSFILLNNNSILIFFNLDSMKCNEVVLYWNHSAVSSMSMSSVTSLIVILPSPSTSASPMAKEGS